MELTIWEYAWIHSISKMLWIHAYSKIQLICYLVLQIQTLLIWCAVQCLLF